MKYVYKVTGELKTSLRKRFLRFLRLEEPREEFNIVLKNDTYNVGEIISSGTKKIKVKILEKHGKQQH